MNIVNLLKLDWTGTGQPALFFSHKKDLIPTWTPNTARGMLHFIGFNTINSTSASTNNAGYCSLVLMIPIEKILEITKLQSYLGVINWLNTNSNNWSRFSNSNLQNCSTVSWNNYDTMIYYDPKVIAPPKNTITSESDAYGAYNRIRDTLTDAVLYNYILNKFGNTPENQAIVDKIWSHCVILTSISSSATNYYSANTNFIHSLYSRNDNPNTVKQTRPIWVFVEQQKENPIYMFMKPSSYPNGSSSNYFDTLTINNRVYKRPYTNIGFKEQKLNPFILIRNNKIYCVNVEEYYNGVTGPIEFTKDITIPNPNLSENMCNLGEFKTLLGDIK